MLENVIYFIKFLFGKLRIEKIEPIDTLVSIFDEPSKGSMAIANLPSLSRSITSSCSSDA